ncbi:MAG: divalent-cation tolerance protein CutA [Candidatus Heimdallarchaeota archaeon]
MLVSIYITTESVEEASKIGEILVKERLVGCVNILPCLKSIYWWEGKVEYTDETLMFVKTRRDLLKKVIRRVKKLHSYSNPAILALPILEGNKDYLEWIKYETREL